MLLALRVDILALIYEAKQRSETRAQLPSGPSLFARILNSFHVPHFSAMWFDADLTLVSQGRVVAHWGGCLHFGDALVRPFCTAWADGDRCVLRERFRISPFCFPACHLPSFKANSVYHELGAETRYILSTYLTFFGFKAHFTHWSSQHPSRAIFTETQGRGSRALGAIAHWGTCLLHMLCLLLGCKILIRLEQKGMVTHKEPSPAGGCIFPFWWLFAVSACSCWPVLQKLCSICWPIRWRNRTESADWWKEPTRVVDFSFLCKKNTITFVIQVEALQFSHCAVSEFQVSLPPQSCGEGKFSLVLSLQILSKKKKKAHKAKTRCFLLMCFFFHQYVPLPSWTKLPRTEQNRGFGRARAEHGQNVADICSVFEMSCLNSSFFFLFLLPQLSLFIRRAM